MKNHKLSLEDPNNPFMASVSFDYKNLSPTGKQRSRSITKWVKGLIKKKVEKRTFPQEKSFTHVINSSDNKLRSHEIEKSLNKGG